MGFPRHRQAIKPVRPPKGHFTLAGRTFPRVAWWRSKNLRLLYFYIVILILTNTANGFDGSMMNGLQTLSWWRDYFDNPKGSTLGLFNASMSLGSLIGLFFVPYLVDWLGRKSGIIIGCIIMLLAVGLQSGAQNFGMFIAARLLLGLGDCIVLGSAPLLIAEIAHPQDRAILVTLSGASYHSGAFIASWTTYGTLQIPSDWSWRLPSLLQAICTIIIIVVVPFMPESPRWYLSKDQPEKALKVLAYYHGEDNERDEFVQLEYSEIRAAIELDKNTNSWADFFRTKGNRKRIGIITAIGFFSQWSGNGLISYYLHQVMNNIGITSAETQLGINGGLKTWGLFNNILFSFLVDKLGRRPIYLVSTIGTTVAFTIWTIISARYAIEEPVGPGLGIGVVFMIFVYSFFYDVKGGVMANYTTEILPYGLRAKGFTWLNFCVTAALFFNQYVNSIALDALAWKYYIFYCVFLLFEVFIIYFFIVETRYTPMEEIAKFFDGEDAADVADIANSEVKEQGGVQEVEQVGKV
ncbi:hypothetical protein AJ80_09297 [Polytolypa hystricis UAMH7299]|uniref:Major facilitator superfamily (MFS) profile domain-containing protein n=1 Tax=Polytolypa hystricis (strain UAMH7299) TaxID=1447883 RepID=A0A2B7WK54_POLH7|nr:hypothetical protein AJ80_09297 [Polytolypa hystricis UAMH7299]